MINTDNAQTYIITRILATNAWDVASVKIKANSEEEAKNYFTKK